MGRDRRAEGSVAKKAHSLPPPYLLPAYGTTKYSHSIPALGQGSHQGGYELCFSPSSSFACFYFVVALTSLVFTCPLHVHTLGTLRMPGSVHVRYLPLVSLPCC
jgi:hypothetical protein